METRVPPPFIEGLALLLVGLLWKFAPGLRLNFPLVFMFSIGGVLSLAGLFIIGSAIGLFRRKHTTILPFRPETSSALVVDGIYTLTRNPMYLGMSMIILAAIFVTQQPLGLIPLLAAAAYLTRFQIIPEERALEASFGADYVNYKAHVRRWF